MNAPTNIDSAVKIEACAAALRAVSAAWRALMPAVLACAMAVSTRF
jgi:hypothetical protein